jgi:SAM-dependent methyltransferase
MAGNDSPSAPGGEFGPPKTVLNVGCGYASRQGLHPIYQGTEWRELRLDINPEVNPDILCSMTDMRPIASGSIDAVWSSHNLEHLQRHEVPIALSEFRRVLRPGGEMLVTLPDLQRIAELVAGDGLEDEAYSSPAGPITPLDMIYGHIASLTRGNEYMAHRTGFTARTLRQLLIEAGFIGVAIQREGFSLWARAFKPAA